MSPERIEILTSKKLRYQPQFSYVRRRFGERRPTNKKL